MISRSVPQMPTATASTSTDPRSRCGSGTSRNSADCVRFVWTVNAFTGHSQVLDICRVRSLTAYFQFATRNPANNFSVSYQADTVSQDTNHCTLPRTDNSQHIDEGDRPL